MSAYPNQPQQPPGYAPAPEGGTKILLLLVSFIFPIAGIIIGVIYLQRPDPASQKFAQQAIIAAVSFFGVGCLCGACYFIFVFGLGMLPLLLVPFGTPSSGSSLLVLTAFL